MNILNYILDIVLRYKKKTLIKYYNINSITIWTDLNWFYPYIKITKVVNKL